MGLSRARAPGIPHRPQRSPQGGCGCQCLRASSAQRLASAGTQSAERLAVTTEDPPAQRLAAIPSPGAGSDSDTQLSGYSQAPGGPEFDKSESCAVHWQSNLSEWSRPAVDGLTILLSTWR